MIRKAILSLIVIIFINFVTSVIILYSLERNYLSADFYNGPAGEKISEIAAISLSKKIAAENVETGLNPSQANYYKMIKSLFSREFVHLTAESFFQQLETFPQNKSLKIYLSNLKENTEPATLEIANAIVDEMPECEKEDLQNSKTDELNCIPPTIEKEELVVQIQQEIETNLVAYIPDEIVIDKNHQLDEQLGAVSRLLTQKEQYKIAAVIVFFVLLILIALVIFRPWPAILICYGSTFILTGLVLLLNGLLLDNLEIIISNFVKQNLNPEVLSHMNFFLQFLIKDLLFTGSIALAIGAVIYISGKLFKSYRIEQPQSR